jgi:hypothetical protein
MAYVAISRGALDAQVFTNDAAALGKVLSRDVSHAPAIQQASAYQLNYPGNVTCAVPHQGPARSPSGQPIAKAHIKAQSRL